MKYFCGIDNGVTGTIGIVDEFGKIIDFFKTPVFKDMNYKKAKKKTKKNPDCLTYCNRINTNVLIDKIGNFVPENDELYFAIERPMINGGRFAASISAARAFEATIIVVDKLRTKRLYIDSKKWQNYMLPDIKGSDNLKIESAKKGIQLCNKFSELINKHGDADGMLIAKFIQEKFKELKWYD